MHPSVPAPGFWLPTLSLCWRELVRFLRQRNRIIGALATPVVFWLLIGGGMGTSVRLGPGGHTFLHYFFPGTLIMILLFTAIFSTISIIEDRREGFLQSVLVAPVSRASVVMGKVLGGTVLATGQGLLFLALAPWVGFEFTLGSALLTIAVMFVVSFALTSLGFCIAWRMTSTQGFHAIMNLFLMPMWFLSGALFPVAGAVIGLKVLMLANPLTYGLDAMRDAMNMGSRSVFPGPAFATSFGITVAFALAIYLLASWIAKRGSDADLG